MSTQVTASDSDDRLRRFESVTDADLAHLDAPELLVELLDRVRDLLDVDTAAVLLLDGPAEELVPVAARGLEEGTDLTVRLPVGEGFAGRIATEKEPLSIEQVDHTDVLNPTLQERGVQSLLGVPMLVGGDVIGVMHVGTVIPRHFNDDDVALLRLVADRVALATQAHRTSVDIAAAAALQRSLLPARLPAVSGLDMAARYLPGEAGTVGGDWYDVFSLPSGWFCVAIGDVVGHGLPAAVVMGRIRSALRAYALDTDDAGEILTKLDRKIQHFEPSIMATVLFAMFSPNLDQAHISSAGHLSPIIKKNGEPAAVVGIPVDLPLGATTPGPRRTYSVDVPPGAALCFYTDGLVERRGEDIDAGIERFREMVPDGPARSTCSRAMRELIGSTPPNDDVALLVVRRI